MQLSRLLLPMGECDFSPVQATPALCFQPGQRCGGKGEFLSLQRQPYRWQETPPGWHWPQTELFDRKHNFYIFAEQTVNLLNKLETLNLQRNVGLTKPIVKQLQ